jgi:hypothetical protein
MLFPACPAFLTWAAAADLQSPIQTGSGSFYGVLVDEKLVPVFGRPLDQWTDDELALFRDGMQDCTQLAARSRPQGTPDPAIQKAHMLAAALPSARAAIGQFKQAQKTLAEQRRRLETIEPTLGGVQQLRVMERDPALQGLAPQERQAHVQRMRLRQAQIANGLTNEAIKELERFPPGLQDLDDLVQYRNRVKGIEAALHEAECAKTMTTVDLSSQAARLQVLGPLGPTTLGDLICRLVLTGHEFHSYDGPAVSGGSDSLLKATANPGGYQTIVLHQGEVAPGTEMLVGKMIKDANVERPLSVQEWQSYAAFLTGQTLEAGMNILQQIMKRSGQ